MRKDRVWATILVLFFLLASCGPKKQDPCNIITLSAGKEGTPFIHEVALPTQIIKPSEWDPLCETQKILHIELQGQTVSLYGINLGTNPSALLEWNTSKYTFDWICLSPQGVFPTAKLLDADTDGQDELLIVLHSGSGTGVSVDQLHLVEMLSDGTLVDYTFAADSCVEEIYDHLQIDMGQNATTFSIGSESIVVQNVCADDCILGNVINFEIVGDEIVVTLGIWIENNSSKLIDHIADLTAYVSYQDGSFTLYNLKLLPI